MKGEYIIKRHDILETFYDWNEIPDDFDHLISFKPEYPEGPHSEDEHELMATYNNKLQELMEIERASSNKNR